MTVANTFEQTLAKMELPALIELASSEYGLNIADNVPAEKIRLEILRQHQERLGKAQTMNEKSAMMVMNENDPLLTVVFRPMDFQNADLKFAFDSKRGIVNKKGTKKEQERQRELGCLDSVPQYHLFPGQTYMLPASVVKHLQSLTYIDSEPVIDMTTGMISGNRPIHRPRFSLDIQLTDSQIKSIGKTSL